MIIANTLGESAGKVFTSVRSTLNPVLLVHAGALAGAMRLTVVEK